VKPCCADDAVAAVRYILRHVEGDESLPQPARMEVFDHHVNGYPAAPEVT